MVTVFEKLGAFFGFASDLMNYKVFGDFSLMQLFAPMVVIVLILTGKVRLIISVLFRGYRCVLTPKNAGRILFPCRIFMNISMNS